MINLVEAIFGRKVEVVVETPQGRTVTRERVPKGVPITACMQEIVARKDAELGADADISKICASYTYHGKTETYSFARE